MQRTKASILILLLFCLAVPKTVFAVTVEVNNAPTSLNDEQEFIVSVSVSGASSNTNNYLRGAFYSDTSPTSYFGYTFNHLNNWYNGSPSPIDPHQFLQIQIGSDGSWSGEVKVKPDISSSNFTGSGSYSFKIGRYTANGTSVSKWSQPNSLSINTTDSTATPVPTSVPTNTPTPTKTPTPTPTTKPSPTPKTPTPTKIPTPTPIKLGPTVLPILIANDVQESTKEALPTSILGESTESAASNISPTDNPKIKISPPEKKTTAFESSSGNLSKILIGIGVIFVISCGILAFRGYIKSRKENEFSG
jgi:hypothetical protein